MLPETLLPARGEYTLPSPIDRSLTMECCVPVHCYYRSTLSRRGRTTIPIELRKKLDLREGDALVWRLENGVLAVEKARSHVDRSAGLVRPSLTSGIPFPSLKEMEDAIASSVLERHQPADPKR